MLQLKRAYDPPSVEDVYRVLVDCPWACRLKRHGAFTPGSTMSRRVTSCGAGSATIPRG